MDVTPMSRYAEPDYPTQDVLDRHPELLRQYPRRWQSSALLLSLVTTACGLALPGQPADAKSRVAPIFKHGEGNTESAYGTTSGNSPVLLPEDEAYRIINEELGKAGIHITTRKAPSYKLTVTATDRCGEMHHANVALTMDGRDPKRRIAYGYLSARDHFSYGSYDDPTLAEDAGLLQKALKSISPKGTSVIFYDPATQVTSGMLGSYTEDAVKVPGMRISSKFSDATLMPLDIFHGESHGMGMRATLKGNTLTVTNGEKKVVLTVGSNQAVINGKDVTLPVKTIKRDGSVYTPVRALAEGLGFGVEWYKKTQIVTLTGQVFIYARDGEGQVKKRFINGTYISKVMASAEDHTKAPKTFAFISYGERFEWSTPDQSNAKAQKFYELKQDYVAYTTAAKVQSREDLRLQVRDFLAWLKKEGVI